MPLRALSLSLSRWSPLAKEEDGVCGASGLLRGLKQFVDSIPALGIHLMGADQSTPGVPGHIGHAET